jgi:hypothetical protein
LPTIQRKAKSFHAPARERPYPDLLKEEEHRERPLYSGEEPIPTQGTSPMNPDDFSSLDSELQQIRAQLKSLVERIVNLQNWLDLLANRSSEDR